MYKLMIVEDEEVIREGLVQQIPWKRYGFRIVGEAGNGKEAMEMIPHLLPDIVLTDVVMPVMGGIDLIAWAKAHYPNMKLVVLSGYNEFEYARKCIEYRAFGYLLKPTNYKEIENVFSRAKDELDGSHDSALAPSRNVIHDLLHGRIDAKQAVSIRPSVWNGAACYVAIRFHIHGQPWPIDMADTVSAWELEEDGTGARIAEAIAIDAHTAGVVLSSHRLLSASACIRIAERLRDNMRSLIAQDAETVAISVGIGTTCKVLAQIGASWKESAYALSAKFFRGHDAIVHYADYGERNGGGASSVSGEIDRLTAAIVDSTITRKADSLHRSLSDYYDTLSGLNVNDKELIFMKTVEIMIMLSVKLTEEDVSFKQLYDGNIHMDIRHIVDNGTLRDLVEWVRAICGQVLTFLAERNGNHHADPVIERAKAYIHDHYDRKISLEEIGEHTFMSPTHFCKLFKQKTGLTFIGYVTQVRLAKAKELLKQPDMKIYEVAVAVGYDDFRHFSKLFKKYEGHNPKEWAADQIKPEAARSER